MKLALILVSSLSYGQGFNYRHSTELSPNDYLNRQKLDENDAIFSQYQTLDLGIDLGIGSDCGQIDIKKTLQGSLKNLLDSQYFESLGSSIVSGSPMLLTCYFSPTWCAILKHTRVNANHLSKLRLDQCSIIDRYVDSRTEDFKRERQNQIHDSIKKSSGNMETAMRNFGNKSNYNFDLTNWAGKKFGKKSENRLIESSAKWAGLTSKEAEKTINLLKSLVGDIVVGKGRVSVDYGPRKKPISPKMRLSEIEHETYQKLCHNKMPNIEEIDPQTLRYLGYLPFIKKRHYCRKLAASVSLNKFATEMGRSLEALSILEDNPNLPEIRKKELGGKRVRLSQSIDSALRLQNLKNSPLNAIMAQITSEGRKYEGQATDRVLGINADKINFRRSEMAYFDCSDGVLCDTQGN